MCDCFKGRSAASSDIDKALQKAKKDAQYNIRLLLLGIGGSGKSTVAKQLKIIYNNGFSSQELSDYKAVLQLNTLKSMKTLVQQCKKLNLKIPSDLKDAVDYFEAMNPLTTQLDESIVPNIKKLWNCESIQEAYKKNYNITIPPCTQYCFENVDRMASPDYVPDYQDILQARQRTTGIIETYFKLEKYTFTVVDVGGQRSERRKWIHCFDQVTALLYCVAMDEYDLMSIEDETVNRMHESLKVFEETINESWFKNTSVIVFLNKDDLFRNKIKEVDLNVCFPDYTGGKDYDKARDHIKGVFASKNHSPETKTLYIHVTVAVDTDNIRFVFNAVKDIIFSERLKNSGLMF